MMKSDPKVLEYCNRLVRQLRQQPYRRRDGGGVDRRSRPAWRRKELAAHQAGRPAAMEVGPRDVQADAVFLARRDRPAKQKQSVPRSQMVETVADRLEEMQTRLFHRAKTMQQQHTRPIDSLTDFRDFFTPQNADRPEIHGGFALCHWHEDPPVDESAQRAKGDNPLSAAGKRRGTRTLPVLGQAQLAPS